jgi:hypothetical protein
LNGFAPGYFFSPTTTKMMLCGRILISLNVVNIGQTMEKRAAP